MKKLVFHTLVAAMALGLLLALIFFGVSAAHRPSHSGPSHSALPSPPLHSAIGDSDISTLNALPEGNAHADVVGAADGPTLPHAAAPHETETVKFVEGTTSAE